MKKQLFLATLFLILTNSINAGKKNQPSLKIQTTSNGNFRSLWQPYNKGTYSYKKNTLEIEYILNTHKIHLIDVQFNIKKAKTKQIKTKQNELFKNFIINLQKKNDENITFIAAPTAIENEYNETLENISKKINWLPSCCGGNIYIVNQKKLLEKKNN